jgi:hypothetical protein
MRRAAILGLVALVVGCGGGGSDGGGSDALRVSLDDVDSSGGFWTIRATCTAGASRSSSVRARSSQCRGSATHRARRSPSHAGSPSASQSQTRSFAAAGPRRPAQTWSNRPSSRRDSVCCRRFPCGRGPPGLDDAERDRRWRLPRRARRSRSRQRCDPEGGVRGSGLAAAVVAGALPSGVATFEALSRSMTPYVGSWP